MYCEYGGGGRRKDGNGTLTGEGVGSSGRNKCWGNSTTKYKPVSQGKEYVTTGYGVGTILDHS